MEFPLGSLELIFPDGPWEILARTGGNLEQPTAISETVVCSEVNRLLHTSHSLPLPKPAELLHYRIRTTIRLNAAPKDEIKSLEQQ